MSQKLLRALGWASVLGSIVIQTAGSITMLAQPWPWSFLALALECAVWLRDVNLGWGIVVAVLWPIAVVIMFLLFFSAP